MKARDPKPEIQRLEELVLAIRRGEIRLPRFQRPFVWSRTDMLDLLDSIYNGYPIGSILLWHSSERLKSEREIVGFEVAVDQVDTYPTDYLLDGQQRLTTLCGSLYWNGVDEKSIWRIYFDLESEQFTYLKRGVTAPITFFPMNRLMGTSDFIRQCTSFQSTANPKILTEKAEKLLQAFKDYKIAVVRIGDISLEEVAPIFERINSTGRKLTMVDLMRAATWKQGFDLTDAIDGTVRSVKSAGYGDLADTNVLRAISAAAGFGVNKEDIDKLRLCNAQQLAQASDAARRGLMLALQFLKKAAGLDDLSFLPYSLQLAHLAEYFRRQPNPTDEEESKLARWFWATSTSRYFAGSSTGQNARDLAQIRSFADRSVGDPWAEGDDELDISQFLFDSFNLRNASTTAFVLLLKFAHPKLTVHGDAFDAAHVKEKERHVFEDLILPGNPAANRNIGIVINPFKEIMMEGDDRIFSVDSLASNLLNNECIRTLEVGDGMQFSLLRAELIANVISELTGVRAVYDASPFSESFESA